MVMHECMLYKDIATFLHELCSFVLIFELETLMFYAVGDNTSLFTSICELWFPQNLHDMHSELCFSPTLDLRYNHMLMSNILPKLVSFALTYGGKFYN